jgi:signal transduction histidine kinase
MLEVQAEKKGVELVNLFKVKLEPIMIDQVKIQSVITNLLDNAIKFTPAGGRVEISAGRVQSETDSGYVELIVSDTGIGISPAERDKIFHRFYQVQQATNRDVSGVGLGLALARSFALAHGGWLRWKERTGWATTFSFGLPVQAESQPRRIYIQKSRFHFHSMLNGIIRLLEEEHGKTLDIEVQWSPTGEVEDIEADREGLRSILINIFQNTMRYRTQNTPIHVFVTPLHEELYIVIETEGLPFPEDKLKQILEVNGRKNTEMSPSRSLFSLRTTVEILRAHGGDLEILNFTGVLDRREKTGVRFTIRLPHRLARVPVQGGRENEQKKNPDY